MIPDFVRNLVNSGMTGICRHYLLALISISMLWAGTIDAQELDLCSGSQGENIFSSGNFGSGPQNIYPIDPGIAPGFFYTINVPPDDGEYTFTHDMAQWPFLFDSWNPAREQTDDPNGYIMVVNASFSPGIFYMETVNGLCENTTYAIYADIINLIQTGIPNFILPNVTFLLDDNIVYTTGQIPQNNIWNTYGFTFTTSPGQTSVTLTLRNNAPGGIGNDLALDNIEFRACGPLARISVSPDNIICGNGGEHILHALIEADTGFVQWQIQNPGEITFKDIPGATMRDFPVPILSSGRYAFRYLYGNTSSALLNEKCTIVSDTSTVEVVPVEFFIEETLCEGLTYTYEDTVISDPGDYTFNYVGQSGCDSLVTLRLNFVPDPGIDATFQTQAPSCEGAADGSVSLISVDGTRPPFTFILNDSILPALTTHINLPAGEYTVRVQTAEGCYDEEIVHVADGPLFEVLVSGPDTIRIGHTANVNAVFSLPADSIQWFPFAQAQCPYCESTPMYLEETGWIGVGASTEGGCTDVDSIFIFIDRTPILYIPNVISPDNDGINDQLIVYLDPLVITSIERFYVFDRWGNMHQSISFPETFETMMLWDGRSNRGLLNPGVFAYILIYHIADGSRKVAKGDITIIR